MYVTVTPNLKAFQVRLSNHVIYAHQNELGEVYIGQSDCMVNRWNQHHQIANSQSDPKYDQKFQKSLRKSKRWNHYIVAIADNQQSANDAESAAIQFYQPKLNTAAGPSMNTENIYNFKLLNGDGREISLEAKRIDRYRKQERFSDKERKTIKCKAIRKPGQSHISFECISDGVRVNVAHDKREGFHIGDIVNISHTAKGKTFYTTTDYSLITRVQEL